LLRKNRYSDPPFFAHLLFVHHQSWGIRCTGHSSFRSCRSVDRLGSHHFSPCIAFIPTNKKTVSAVAFYLIELYVSFSPLKQKKIIQFLRCSVRTSRHGQARCAGRNHDRDPFRRVSRAKCNAGRMCRSTYIDRFNLSFLSLDRRAKETGGATTRTGSTSLGTQ